MLWEGSSVQQLPSFLQKRISQPGIASSTPAAAVVDPLAVQPLSPQEEVSLLGKMGSGVLSGIATVGNGLDIPGSMVRDTLTFSNPFDQLLTPFSHVNRKTGRDVLAKYGVTSENDPNRWEFADVAGFGAEVALDPFFWLPAGSISRGLNTAKSAIPESARAAVAASAVGRGAEAAGRHAAALFDTSVLGNVTASKQSAAREVTSAAERLAPDMMRDRQSAVSASMEGDAALRQLGPEILNQVQQRPVVPHPADVFERASQIQGREMVQFENDAAAQLMRGFKGSDSGRSASMTARNLHRAGRDWDAMPGFDTMASSLRGDAEEFGTAMSSWSDEDIWQALIHPQHIPVRGDFMNQAFNEVSERVVQGGSEAEILQPGVAVEVQDPRVSRMFSEIDGESIVALDGLPDKASGFLVEVGTRESKILFRKGDKFEIQPIPNEKVFNTSDGAVHTARANDYLEKISSDLARDGGELSSLDPNSFESAFERLTGLAADEETAQEAISVFKGLTQYQLDGSGVGPIIGGIKDKLANEVSDLGGNINFHSIETGSKVDHYPRGVPKAIVGELEKAGVSPQVINLAFDSMKARRPELRDLPTQVIEEILSNPRYRGGAASRKILEDFEGQLDEVFGVKTVEPVPAEIDGILFDTDALDEMDDFIAPDLAEEGLTGVEAHAEALASFVKKHNRGTMYSNLLKKDMDQYIRGAYRSRTMLEGMHNYLNKSAAKKIAGDNSYTVREVYEAIAEKNNSIDVERVKSAYERMFGVTSDQFDELRISGEDAQTALNFNKLSEPEKWFDNPVGDFIDTFNKSFKSWVTQLFPAFHSRNHFSGQIVNLMFEDVKIAKYAKDYKSSWDLVKGASEGSLAPEQMSLVEEMYLHGVIDLQHAGYGVEAIPPSVASSANAEAIIPPYPTLKKNDRVDPGDVVKANDRNNFGRATSVNGDTANVRFVNPETGVDAFVDLPLEQLSPRRKDFFVRKQEAADTVQNVESPGFLDPANKLPGATEFRTRLQQLFGTGSNAGRLAEFMNRAPLYKHLRDQGLSAAEAAKRVERLHFDYSKHTGFEAGVAKRAFPFYTFARRMSELTFRELANKPGGKLAETIRATRLGDQGAVGTPDYIAQTTSIPLGSTSDGSDRYLTGFGLAHEDPLSLVSADSHSGLPDLSDTFAELISRSTPIAKFPVEMAAGESFFQRGPMGGRELTDMDPTLGRLLTNVGLRDEESSGRARPLISNEFEHLAANSPWARVFSTARVLTDKRKYEGGPFPGSMAALNLLTGVKTSDISPAAQAAVLRERAQAYALESLGARAFENVYHPKEEIAKVAETDPKRAKNMQVVNNLKKIAERVRNEKLERAGQSSLPPGQ